MYFWLKILHIVFVTSWFAGLFYLPRIFVNLAQTEKNPAVYDYVLGMSKRLLRFMTIIAVPAVVFGLWLMIQYKLYGGWMHVKLLFVAFVVLYHYTCYRLHQQFTERRNTRSHIFYRWFNEIPLILLLVIVAMVIIKPF